MMVVLANFYDAVIDSPAALDRLKELVDSWTKGGAMKKEVGEKCAKYAEGVKLQLEDEYKRKSKA